MIWENEHYKFVITPRWVRTSKEEYTEKPCHDCLGSGRTVKDDYMFESEICSTCRGVGLLKKLVPIPKPPEMDKDFLEVLDRFVQEYK
jgi:hypothetical protein